MAQWSDGFQGHVAGTLHGPLIVLLEQQGADQADDGSFVWKDTDDLAAPFDLAVEPFQRIGIGYAVAGFRRVRREACT
jgi:hypothetical protein